MCDSDGIRSFFQNQTVFITGGTGFLGKLLIEKLLYSCEIKKIYILVRPKKGKSVKERFDDFFSSACFERVKNQNLELASRIRFINGDCELPKLGISAEFEETLSNEANVVIHAAANVKFDQSLRIASNINVRGTREVLNLAKSMKNLKSFIYVSTAFSNCPQGEIEEEFYEPPTTYRNLFDILDGIDDDILEEITPKLIGKWPNTYVYTKSIAEDLIRAEGGNLPLAIVRPGIVTSSFHEPVSGWVDNFYGVVGMTVVTGLGVVTSLNGKPHITSHMVPCDYVANFVLAAAWSISKEKHDAPIIYNYVGSEKNIITYNTYLKIVESNRWNYPTTKAVWYPNFRFIENNLLYKIYVFVRYMLVAYLVDLVFIIIGKKPMAVANYRRLNKQIELFSFFMLNELKFHCGNVEKLWEKIGDEEQRLFNFNMNNLDWKFYIEKALIGGRMYLLKDPLDTLPKAQRKLFFLCIAYYTCNCLFWLFILTIVKMMLW